MAHSRRDLRGVALLLEAIICLGLFATAILFTMGVITGVSQGSAQSREYSLARQQARQALEQQRVLPYGSIGSPAPAPYLVTVPFVNNGLSLAIVYTVTVLVAEAVPGERKDILVTVAWDHGGTPRQVQLETSAVNL